jgi:hypothetical protein
MTRCLSSSTVRMHRESSSSFRAICFFARTSVWARARHARTRARFSASFSLCSLSASGRLLREGAEADDDGDGVDDDDDDDNDDASAVSGATAAAN